MLRLIGCMQEVYGCKGCLHFMHTCAETYTEDEGCKGCIHLTHTHTHACAHVFVLNFSKLEGFKSYSYFVFVQAL
eukprot:c43974_g1_i1 orf=3-224(-)